MKTKGISAIITINLNSFPKHKILVIVFKYTDICIERIFLNFYFNYFVGFSFTIINFTPTRTDNLQDKCFVTKVAAKGIAPLYNAKKKKTRCLVTLVCQVNV